MILLRMVSIPKTDENRSAFMLCSTSQRWLFIFKHSQEAIEAATEPVFSFHFVMPGMHFRAEH